MTTRKGVTNWGSSLPGRYGKNMRWQLWHSSLRGPVLAFWEGPMLMLKEGTSLYGSVLGSLFLAFHCQLSSLGWPWLRIESHMPLCSAFWSLLPLSLTLCLLSRSAQLCRRTRSGLRGVAMQNGWGIVLGGCSVALKLGRSAYMDVSAGMSHLRAEVMVDRMQSWRQV